MEFPMSLEDLKTRVQTALDKVRPALQQDGGDVQLVNVTEEGAVSVKLQGHCYGCPFSQMTVKNLVERVLRQEVPEVTQVINLQ
jgi:Fe-S cluster biogenesis protein NfuA